MTWLLAIGLTNAVLAGLLAVFAWGIERSARRPALTRLVWILVLCKLLAPPLYKPDAGNWLPAADWLAQATADREPAVTLPTAADVSHAAETRLTTVAAESATSSPLKSAGAAPKTRLPTGGAADVRATVVRHGWLSSPAAIRPTLWGRYAAGLWLCGSAVYIVWIAIRAGRFRRFLGRVAHADAELSERVAHLARDAGLSSAPRVLVVESAVSPMLWGAGRGACLLFPAQLRRRLDTAACDTLLLHELAHYARGDWLVRVLELAAQILYWWHPLVWYALRHIEAAEEECCDAWVVKHRAGGRRVYAEALLSTLDFLCEPRRALPPAACGLGAAGALRARLTQIMCGDVAVASSRTAKSLILAMAAVVLPLSPSIVGSAPREAAALTVAQAETSREMGPDDGFSPRLRASVPPRLPAFGEHAATGGRGDAELDGLNDEGKPLPWFVPRDTAPPLMPALYATAVSPNGRFQLEARTGHRAALINVASNKRLDLSAYRILAASFSADSRLLATGQDDESIVRLWDADSGEILSLLKGSEAAITSVAFGPDSARVAAGTADGSVLIWTVGEEDVAARLPRQDSPVSCLRWSKSGDRLAIALSDWSNRDWSSLVVWRPDETTVAQELSLDHSLGALEWLDEEAILAADWSGAARVLKLASDKPAERFWIGKETVSAAAFSPDCRLMPRWQALSQQQGAE